METEIICSHSKLNVIEEEKIVIDLERSEYVETRKHYLKTLKIPTISEIKKNLGPKLAPIIFEICPEEQKRELGLIPPLQGPGNTLWTSPSDLLIGKVCLKPPFTSKHIKALTHQGILEIGYEIERKYWNQMELEKELALAEQKAELLFCFERELKKALVCLGVRLHEECTMKIAALTMHFEWELMEMLRAQEEALKQQFRSKLGEIEDAVKNQAALCEQAIADAVKNTVKDMSVLFLKDLDRQHEVLCEYFGAELKRSEIQKHYELQKQLHRVRNMFQNVKHQLECRNIANMMYILCMERRKCNSEKCAIEKYYKDEMEKLEVKVAKQTDNIKKLMEERHVKTQEVNLREKCIIDILAQFQKFINYALKASPTQAEFLLSIEKLMVFELAESIKKTKVVPKKEEPPLKKWRKGKSPGSSTHSLTVDDFHNCYNMKYQYVDKDSPLPSVYFKKHLYVREDFRDMILSVEIEDGFEVTPDHDLWSKDVEILIDKLKETAYEEPEELSDQEAKPLKPARRIYGESKDPAEIQNVKFNIFDVVVTNVKSRKMSDEEIVDSVCEKEIKIQQPCKPLGISTITDLKQVVDFLDYSKIGAEEKKNTLLSTKDSTDIYKTTLRDIYNPKFTKEESDSESVCTEMVDSTDQLNITDYLNWIKENEFPEQVETEQVDHTAVDAEAYNSEPVSQSEVVHKPKAAGSKVSIYLNADSKMAVATRDSVISVRISLMTEDRTNIEVRKDSIDQTVDTQLVTSRTKLLETKNSAEIYRKSLYSLKSCNKCKCTGPSDIKKQSTVSFSKKDHMIDLQPLEKIYKEKPLPHPKPMKVKKKICLQKVKNKCKVAGDRRAKEYIQDPQQFTTQRINSLINLIKDNPNLIGMFTSGSK